MFMETKLTTTTETPKLKLSTTVQVYNTIELNFDLPYYCKQNVSGAIIKVVSETEALFVCTGDSILVCNPKHGHTAGDIAKSVQCSKEEFDLAYETALSIIQNLAK